MASKKAKWVFPTPLLFYCGHDTSCVQCVHRMTTNPDLVAARYRLADHLTPFALSWVAYFVGCLARVTRISSARLVFIFVCSFSFFCSQPLQPYSTVSGAGVQHEKVPFTMQKVLRHDSLYQAAPTRRKTLVCYVCLHVLGVHTVALSRIAQQPARLQRRDGRDGLPISGVTLLVISRFVCSCFAMVSLKNMCAQTNTGRCHWVHRGSPRMLGDSSPSSRARTLSLYRPITCYRWWCIVFVVLVSSVLHFAFQRKVSCTMLSSTACRAP